MPEDTQLLQASLTVIGVKDLPQSQSSIRLFVEVEVANSQPLRTDGTSGYSSFEWNATFQLSNLSRSTTIKFRVHRFIEPQAESGDTEVYSQSQYTVDELLGLNKQNNEFFLSMHPQTGTLALKLAIILSEDKPPSPSPPACYSSSHLVHPTITRADEVVDNARKKLQSVSPGDATYFTSLTDLGRGLIARFGQTKNLDDASEAIGYFKTLVDAIPGYESPFGPLVILGVAFMARFQLKGDTDDLNQAIDYQSRALDLCSPQHENYISIIVNLGSLLKARFSLHGNSRDLDSALQLYSSSLSECSLDNPHRDMLLNNYATALLDRFQQHADPNDLALAIDHYQSSLKLRPPGHPARHRALSNLGDALQTRFMQQGNQDDLETSAVYYLNAVQLCPATDPDFVVLLMNLGIVWWTAFLYQGAEEKLQNALHAYATALPLCPRDHTHYARLLANYASALQTRFKHERRPDDLDAAIKFYTEALTLQPIGNNNRFATLLGLGTVLWDRFNESGSFPDLESAISHFALSLDLCGPDHSEYPTLLAAYSAALAARYKETGNPADLDLAITYADDALMSCPQEHSSRGPLLTTANNALMTRFRQRKDVHDLEQVLRYCDCFLAKALPGNIAYATLLMDRATALLERFQHNGDPTDLESSIDVYSEVVNTLKEGQASFSEGHIQLGTALQVRFKLKGNAVDLNQAIDHYQIALKLCPPGHTNHVHSLTNLGNALLTRAIYFHDLDALDMSVVYLTKVVELHPDPINHPNYCEWLVNISHALIVRFQEKHDREDLNRAIDLLLAALEVPNLSDLPTVRLNLGTALIMRFDESDEPNDLEESVQHLTAALEGLSPKHPYRWMALMNLGRVLSKQYALKKIPDQLESVIKYLQASIELILPNNPDFPLLIMHLADALRQRWTDSPPPKPIEDIDTCYKLLQASYVAIPKDHPYLFHYYRSLAAIQLHIHGLDTYVDGTVELLERAASLRTVGVWSQLDGALRWVAFAEHHHHPSALKAYRRALNLLDRHILSTPSVALRHKALQEKQLVTQWHAPSLASDAAACALREGSIELAIELLEQGRGLLWSQLARFRTSLNALSAVDEEGQQLAGEFERVSVLLDRRSSETIPSPGNETRSRMSLEEEARRYRVISGEWDSLVEKIRAKKGFANFLQPIPYTELKGAAVGGPVVVINISRHRCDGIIALKAEKPRLVPLPDATMQDITQMASDWMEVLANTSGEGEEKMREKQLIPILRQLWDTVVGPISEELANIAPRGSRVWWCPSSKLTSLPLHAAGSYRKGGSNLANLYVSSYTPTLSALIRSRRERTRTAHSETPTRAFLSIGQAKPNESSRERELVSVGTELELVKSIVPPSISYDELSGDNGTCEAAIHSLHNHSWVHLACHGKQDVLQPFDSSFAMRDKPLRLLDIIQADLQHPEFAFLSACHTAIGDKNTPDEVIHLAAGMQFAGFRSVIGTMWAVDDRVAQKMVKEFYQNMFSGETDCTNAARALNKASRSVNKNEVALDQRIVFIHIGA
ncbi:CHAT domain-containing protein [Hygrophoropsis aurantiaca]|uniref:CHAT domain-containing protein n=1 Tax=Hygrophoropsis aurantiaca TaxID=72124 RepID=A0ACB8A1D5_9AGAM|nr:CHAT domain-containing protein [Hygrophoropsis aurantiaca]